MALIARTSQKIFGGNYASTPTNQLAQFGSKAAGSPAFTGDAATIQALPAFLNGWNAAVLGAKSPALEDMNSLFYLATRQLAYVLQRGIPEWESSTDYYLNCFATYGGLLYRCATTGPVSGTNPATDTNNWVRFDQTLAAGSPGVAKAFVRFSDTGSITITQSHNVSSVGIVSTGNYLLTLSPGVFSGGNYTYALSSEQNDSGGSAQILTRFPGDAQDASQFQVRCVNALDSANYRASQVCVVLYSL
jgi:hypothetical protein